MFESVFVIVFSSLGIPRDSHPRFPPRSRDTCYRLLRRDVSSPATSLTFQFCAWWRSRTASSRKLTRTKCRGTDVLVFLPSRRNSSVNSTRILPRQKRAANIARTHTCFDDTLSWICVTTKCCLSRLCLEVNRIHSCLLHRVLLVEETHVAATRYRLHWRIQHYHFSTRSLLLWDECVHVRRKYTWYW